jgi:predicted heme/steroid binding protein
MKLFIAILLLLIAQVALSRQALGSEEYARQTGKACVACHLSPAGGGELTAAGKSFLDQHQQPAGTSGQGSLPWLARLVAGYVHLLCAIFWFGTILYVHLVLKPAYASQGLPRSEVRVGLVSMAVIAVTGTILSLFRVTSPGMLIHTRFGVLLLIKISIFLVMVASALLVVFFIGPRLKKHTSQSPNKGKGDLTPDELLQFNGEEGQPALFACNGEVFEVTGSKLWKNGIHVGRHPAGRDLTEALKLAPHGEDKVLAMPKVGRLIAGSEKSTEPQPRKVFYLMAHMNLAAVFIIVLIVALWRWW